MNKLRKKKLEEKRRLLKSFSNSVSIPHLKESDNNKESQKNYLKKDNSNNYLLNKSTNYNNNNLVFHLNNNKEIEKTDYSRNIFNKKLLINNLSQKPIKEEKPKEEDDEDDLLFFPKRSVKVNNQPISYSRVQNKNISTQLKKLGEEFIVSRDEDKKKLHNEKTKSPKYRKNKIFKRGNEKISALKDLILEEEIQNKGDLFNSLKVNYNYNKELFGDDHDPKIIKQNNSKDTKIHHNNEKEKIYEKENEDENEISNNNNNMNNNDNDEANNNIKKKDKKKLVEAFNESNDDNMNLNINLEKETNSVKDENESKHQNKINIFMKGIENIGNPKINTISLNDSGNIIQNNSIKMSNIKKYQQRTKNRNKDFVFPPLKYSEDNIQFSSTENNKKNISLSTFKGSKNKEEKEEESENDENKEEEDSLSTYSQNKNKKENNNSKLIGVQKNYITNSNKSIVEINDISNDAFMKKKKDNKGRVYSIKIANDPVWCILSMKNNEYLAVGLASGIIRIFNQSEFEQKINIKEHNGAIYSIYLTKKNSNCFLTSSTDKLIKKISISDNFTNYVVLSIFKGHNSSVYKAIELNINQVLSCSDDGYLLVWEKINKNQDMNENTEKLKNQDNNIEKNENNNSINNNNIIHSINLNKLNFVNDFLDINTNNNNNNNNINIISNKKIILNRVNSDLAYDRNNKYQITKKLNKLLNIGEVVYDILQINHEMFVTSSLYGYLRFWNINSMTNTDIIKEVQCNDSHNCLCIINKTVIGVLLNEKYGIALVDYNKKEITHKIVVDKDLEIKLSTILLTSNKLVVIGGQNNGNSEESQVTYKFYKIIKVRKSNSTNFKYSLKFLNAHVKKSQKILPDDDVWLNAMAEGSNGTIINGLGSTYMNKEYGQIDIFFREIKNKNSKEKDLKNPLIDNKNKK